MAPKIQQSSKIYLTYLYYKEYLLFLDILSFKSNGLLIFIFQNV